MNNELLEKAVTNYVKGVQAKVNAYWKEMNFTFSAPPVITWEYAPKYIRVWSIGTQKSIHTFIEASSGNVLKAASWKAPVKNNPRGNVFGDDFGLNGVTHHGAVYLR